MWKKQYFSINNWKYEFLRLPFGLTNAPRFFQRTIDDILRERIWKTCHVYMDDIIIFSNSIEQHIDLNKIINILLRANMKISLEKCIVFYNVIKTDPEKIVTNFKYPLPKNIRELWSSLGLTGCYRKFVLIYVSIAKPLTKYLGGHKKKNFKKNVKKNVNSAGWPSF